MNAEDTIRICGWSGPRNLSTALMRAWENRADCAVWDEPFYAAYLLETGHDHPGRDEVVSACEADRAKVAAACAGPAPDGSPLFYQKQMSHHMPDGADMSWTDGCRHFFLIRDPADVAASYAAVREKPGAEELGFIRQRALYDEIADRQGAAPPVIDARDLRQNPRGVLSALCAALDIEFDAAMLAWPAGKRASDGVWAPYWYASVEKSTGFAPWKPSTHDLPDDLLPVVDQCRGHYEAMSARKLVA